MLILGIETSCDETSAAVIEVNKKKIKVVSNVVSSQIAKHAPFGGVVPSLAAREHVKNLPMVIKQTLGKLTIKDMDLLAVTSGPGLISSLLVGTAFAKTLAYKYKKPIIGVNHMEGHIYSNWLRSISEFSNKKPFPALCLVVSGGHTQLILMKKYGVYKLIGETVDDAAGEAFDKIARILGLEYPGGPAISKISEVGDKEIYNLPRPMLDSKNYNFSFSGLKTSVLYLVRDLLKEKGSTKLDPKTVSNIAASTQEAIVDVLVKKTVQAAKEYKVKCIMLSGGVSANKLLRKRLTSEGEKLNLKVSLPKPEFTTDNAAMIAMAGYFNYKKKHKYDWNKVEANANWELV